MPPQKKAPLVLRHPVGRMPLRARWYLAAMAMLMIVFLAAHFSIQLVGQQQAEAFIQQWQQAISSKQGKASLSVGQVRFHMMRGVLHLKDVHWQYQQQSITIPSLLLQGSFTTQDSMLLSSIQIGQADIRISPALWQDTYTQALPEHWLNIWQSARNISIVDSQFMLKQPQQDLLLQHIHAQAKGMSKQRQWLLRATAKQGRIELHTQPDGGLLQAFNLSARHWLDIAGFSSSQIQTNDTLTGQVQWQLGQYWGELLYQQAEEQGHMTWQGTYNEQGHITDIFSQADSQVELQFERWPVSLMLPQKAWFGGKIQGGVVSTNGKLQRQHQQWRFSAERGTLAGIQLINGAHQHSQIKLATWQQLQWQWPQRQLQLHTLNIEDASIRLDTSKGIVMPTSDWQFNIGALNIASLQLQLPERGLVIDTLSGSGSFKSPDIKLSLQSNASSSGTWQFTLYQRQLRKQKILVLDIQAKQVPLMYFRRDLPRRLMENASLQGQINLQITASYEQGWSIYGQAQIQHMQWQRAGWHWQAEDIDIGGIHKQSSQQLHADTVRINTWQVFAPIVPLSAIRNHDVEVAQHAWLANLNINDLSMYQGRVMIGQQEQTWASKLTVRLRDISPDKASNIQISGLFLDGELRLSGTWQPTLLQQPFQLKASLHDALPFSANDWLSLSGLPQLMQGRISASLHIAAGTPSKNASMGSLPRSLYSHLDLQIWDGALQQGTFDSEVFIEQVGYAPHELFSRLSDGVTLHLSTDFETPVQRFQWSDLGRALLRAMKTTTPTKVQHIEKNILGHMRLHSYATGERVAGYVEGFAFNERVRLRAMIHQLKKNPATWVELEPQLGPEELDEKLIFSVRREQQHIERFFTKRGIAKQRIIHIWPQDMHRNSKTIGLRIWSLKPTDKNPS